MFEQMGSGVSLN